MKRFKGTQNISSLSPPFGKGGLGGFYHAFLFLIALTLLSCSGSPGGGGGILMPGPTDGGGQVSSPFDSSASPSTTGSDEGENGALPTASIPAPTLVKPNPSKMLTASADSNNYIPVIGFEGAGTSGSQIVVSNNPAVASIFGHGDHLKTGPQFGHGEPRRTMYSRIFSPFRKGGFRGIFQWFHSSLPFAYAQLAPDTTCPFENATCCPVQADGSFACYHPGDNDTALYIYTTDGTNLSEPINDHPNTNVLWLKNDAIQMTAGGSQDGMVYDAWSLTAQAGVHIQEVGGVYQVRGNHTDNYRLFDRAGGEMMGYDPVTATIGVLNPLDGIHRNLFDDLAVTDARTATTPEAEKYTMIKYTAAGKLQYAIKPVEDARRLGRIYHVDGVTAPLDFITATDRLPDSVTPFTNFQTDAFDVDSNGTANGTAIALFEDQNGCYRLRMGRQLLYATRFGGTTPLTGPYDSDAGCTKKGVYDLKDIGIYHSQNLLSATQNSGYSLLLDSSHNTVWQVEYKVDRWNRIGTEPAHRLTSTLDPAKAISVGNGATAMSFNETRSKAYVLNSTDKTVSVLTLVNDDGSLKTVAQINEATRVINLVPYLAGKDLAYTPNSIAYQKADTNEYLLIGLQGVQLSLVVDL